MLRLRGNWAGFQEPCSSKRTVPKEKGGRLYTSQSKAPGMEWLQNFQSVPSFSSPSSSMARLQKKLAGAFRAGGPGGPDKTQVAAPEAGRWWLWPWAGRASLHPVRL